MAANVTIDSCSGFLEALALLNVGADHGHDYSLMGIQPYYLVIFALLLIVRTFGQRVYEKTRGRKRPAWMQGYYKQLDASFDDGRAFGADQSAEGAAERLNRSFHL